MPFSALRRTMLDDAPNSQHAATRSRSFGGCKNCRQRHMKCDETRPACLVCQQYGRDCAGYEKAVFFDTDHRQGEGKFRRVLFTEQERRCMSEQLLAAVPPATASRNLHEIDQHCDNASPSQQFQVAFGPFGAFRPPQAVEPCDVPTFQLPLTQSEERDLALTSAADFDLCDQGSPLANFEYDPDPGCFDPVSPYSAGMFLDPDLCLDPWPDIDNGHTTQDDHFLRSLINQSPLSSLTPRAQSGNIPQDAPFLLNNYTESVISSFTLMDSTKSPWNTVFLAHAKQTLATLTMDKIPSHTDESVFYAILSLSAFHFRTSSESQRWHLQANQYRAKARENMRLALQDATSVPKKVKYKPVLMALLLLAQVSKYAGDFDQAECYLLDAEKLIRVRGLKKTIKSRKVRLLHHCYSFPRIFFESTLALPARASSRKDVFRLIEDTSLVMMEENHIPSCEPGRWSKLDEHMLEIKSKEWGENDLHLEKPGLWSGSLYADIFGVPESFMVLLSQTIRLGNEKEFAEQNSQSESLSWKDFWTRANSLESCVLQWQHLALDKVIWDYRLGIENVSESRRAIFRNMLEALSHALSIYFYRRVFNLNPLMLKADVDIVRDSLSRCDALGGMDSCNASFVWPAFIAACEATELSSQLPFSMWFKRWIQTTGLSSFTVMLGVIEQVWSKRRDGDTKTGWQEVLKERNVRLFWS